MISCTVRKTVGKLNKIKESDIREERRVTDKCLYEGGSYVCFLTGTAAISVGSRTVASPLLPFLILVDCEEKINTNTSRQNINCLSQQEFLGSLNIHIFSIKLLCWACRQTDRQTDSHSLLPFLMKVLGHAEYNFISYPEQPPGS